METMMDVLRDIERELKLYLEKGRKESVMSKDETGGKISGSKEEVIESGYTTLPGSVGQPEFMGLPDSSTINGEWQSAPIGEKLIEGLSGSTGFVQLRGVIFHHITDNEWEMVKAYRACADPTFTWSTTTWPRSDDQLPLPLDGEF